MYRNALPAPSSLSRHTFKGQEITEIKACLADIARYLSEFIFFNDVAVEPETGLYSRTYFNLKLREQKKALQSNGTPFSLLLLSFFGSDTNLQAEEFQAAVRGVAAKLAPALGEGDIICRVERDIAILLPGAGLDESITVGERIAGMLQAARMRIDKKNRLASIPHRLASSRETRPERRFSRYRAALSRSAKERERERSAIPGSSPYNEMEKLSSQRGVSFFSPALGSENRLYPPVKRPPRGLEIPPDP
jgi:GGDEF domain-containing protein